MSYVARLFNNKKDAVINRKGENIDLKAHCKGKTVGLLFSAYWCKPCRDLCPEIIKYYEKMKILQKDFEIILISADRNEASFNQYFSKMPWLALDFNEQHLNMNLIQQFQATGLPKMTLIDADTGKIESQDALSEFRKAEFFIPKPILTTEEQNTIRRLQEMIKD